MSYVPDVPTDRRGLLAFILKLDPGRKYHRCDGTGVRTPLKKATQEQLLEIATTLAALDAERKAGSSVSTVIWSLNV
jgi:hypothetical protein